MSVLAGAGLRSAAAGRGVFRRFALDDAVLWFHPATGTHVRVATDATRGLRRQAPRVVMFGITNACNLDCAYCSRDPRRPSRWTVASARAALAGLWEAGTLEVAFGGGEPFQFPGFAELVDQLYGTTTLALHATTNGTWLSDAAWRPFAGRLGAVRVSLHHDPRWRRAAQVLSAHGQQWGANLLVEGTQLRELPGRLAELAALGCHDVALLNHVGGDPRCQLAAADRATLAAVVADAPLPCRVSVCFGAGLPVPRLFAGMDGGGDCGAGRDFVSVTPDQRVQACSFQDQGLPGRTAAEILAAWQHGAATLAAPAARLGCARRDSGAPARATPVPPVAVWQGFSGNNSGECILVARFAAVADAERYLADLIPGWVPEAAFSTQWLELFRTQGVAGADLQVRVADHDDGRVAPRELLAFGPVVVGTVYHPSDAFPELRALAWKRGAELMTGGIHVHEHFALLAAVSAPDAGEGQRLVASPPLPRARCYRHGNAVLVVAPLLGEAVLPSLAAVRDALLRWAGDRPLAVEFLADEDLDPARCTAALQRLGAVLPSAPRLVVQFWALQGDGGAAAFARATAAEAPCLAGNCVLFEHRVRWQRLAVLGLRRRGTVALLTGQTVRLEALFGREPATDRKRPVRDPAALAQAVSTRLPPGHECTLAPLQYWKGAYSVTVVSALPAQVLAAFAAAATQVDCRLDVTVGEVAPLHWALRRLFAALPG